MSVLTSRQLPAPVLHFCMKRFLGFLLDVLFFISFLGVIALVALILIYFQEKDISIINTYLQTDLTRTMLVAYSTMFLGYLVYFWLLPVALKQTIGQRLAGTSYQSEGKITTGRVFLKTIVGRFWDILLFPYTLYAAFKNKASISTKLSGIVITHRDIPASKGLYASTLLFTVFLIATFGIGTYLYRTGITPIMERYTNYEKQVMSLIENLAYQDAAAVLEKYKQQKGENEHYWYYHCVIEANITTDLSSLAVCQRAQDLNAASNDRLKGIISQEAKVYAANSEYEKAAEKYALLWNNYQDRTMDMKNYVVVLSELGKGKEANDILTELMKSTKLDDPIVLRDLGNLYERIGNADIAMQQYQEGLAILKDGENLSLAGELHYSIGVIYYNKGKYTEATDSFNKAKELNKDYAEAVDSYIILISKLKNSVTK